MNLFSMTDIELDRILRFLVDMHLLEWRPVSELKAKHAVGRPRKADTDKSHAQKAKQKEKELRVTPGSELVKLIAEFAKQRYVDMPFKSRDEVDLLLNNHGEANVVRTIKEFKAIKSAEACNLAKLSFTLIQRDLEDVREQAANGTLNPAN